LAGNVSSLALGKGKPTAASPLLMRQACGVTPISIFQFSEFNFQ